MAGSRGEAGSGPGRCERCGVDPRKCGVCATTERGALGWGAPRVTPTVCRRSRERQRAGRSGSWQPAGWKLHWESVWGPLSPTGPRRAPRAGAVPEGIAASQPGLQRARGGELAGKQRGSTSRGAAGTLQGPSRVGATPKTLPRGLCPAPQLPWGRARVNHPGDASRPASLLAQPDLRPQRGARPRHTSRSGPALLLQPR